MLSWSPQAWVRDRKCDAPDCQNDSSPHHGLVARPVVGPVLDIPLRLFFCHDHADVQSLFERYRAAPATGEGGVPVTSPSTRRPPRARAH